MSTRAFEILEEIPVHRGFFFLTRLKLRHTLFGGGWSELLDRELFHRGRCVAVLLYDPIADLVALIEQFRVGALKTKDDPWLLEIVAGAIEEGETPEDVAHREAFEEAGCEIRELIRIGEFYATPGGCSEKVTLFCGLIDSEGVGGIHGVAGEAEDIRVSLVEFDSALALLDAGTIDSAFPALGLQWLTLNRKRLRNLQG